MPPPRDAAGLPDVRDAVIGTEGIVRLREQREERAKGLGAQRRAYPVF